jgi:hypothetical protein
MPAEATCKGFFRRSPRIFRFPQVFWKYSLDFRFDGCSVLVRSTFIMKSKRNLTRFTYESAAFEGWRLCISRAGTTFTKYFPDKKFGSGKKSLAAAEVTLVEIKTLIEGAKRVDGKLTATTIKKAEKILANAV